MRAVLQRVDGAAVTVGGKTVGEIGKGLLVYLGVTQDDGPDDLRYIAGKILNIRIFDDENGVPNRSVLETGGSVLLVSQFTLYGDARHGRRPGYTAAARPEHAKPLFDEMAALLAGELPVATGVFQAYMQVSSVNDGPFTILLDSGRAF